MLHALTEESDVRKAQSELEELLFRDLFARDRNFTLGHQAGGFLVENLRANDSIWYVSLTEDIGEPRYWNAFGLAEHLATSASNAIVVEINVPVSGASARVSGLFARDEADSVYLLHRGKIGGGKVGVGKEAFLNWGGFKLTPVLNEKGQEEYAIIVAKLEASTLVANIAKFVHAVARFKAEIASQ